MGRSSTLDRVFRGRGIAGHQVGEEGNGGGRLSPSFGLRQRWRVVPCREHCRGQGRALSPLLFSVSPVSREELGHCRALQRVSSAPLEWKPMHAVLVPKPVRQEAGGALRVESLAWPSAPSGPRETLKDAQTSVKKTQDSAISTALLSVCPALLGINRLHSDRAVLSAVLSAASDLPCSPPGLLASEQPSAQRPRLSSAAGGLARGSQQSSS